MTVAAYMLVAGPPQAARVHPITSRHSIIGRDRECDLRLAYPTVSRRHCEIWTDDHQIMVRDLESNNGTYVNGVRTKSRRLKFGDLVQVGPLVLQIVRAHDVNESIMELGSADVETADRDLPGPSAAVLGLSPQECEIVRSLVGGKSEKEAAAALKISRHSLHSCVKQIYQRFGLSSRADLSGWYWRGEKGSTP